MSANENPFTWTEEYVQSHHAECISYLQRMNQRTLYELLEGDSYDSVVAGICGTRQGFMWLYAGGIESHDLTVQAVEYMAAEGILLVFGDSSKFSIHTESNRRELALSAFEGVQELGQCCTEDDGVNGLIRVSGSFIRELKAGSSLTQIRRKLADIFPNAADSVALTLRDGWKLLDRVSAVAADEGTEERRYRSATSQESKPEPKSSGSAFGWIFGIVLFAAILMMLWQRVGRAMLSHGGEQEKPSHGVTQEEPTGGREGQQDDGVIFSNSSTELIDQQEIKNLSDTELNYAINEIYARNGYIFRSSELREYYEQFSWYTGTIPANEFSTDCFNSIEQQNCNLLINERSQRNG